MIPDTPLEHPNRIRASRPVCRLQQIFGIVIAIALPGCGYERFLADREIDRLCKIDGGVRVIEYDDPPKEFLRPDGKIDLQNLDRAKTPQSYFIVRTETILRRDPEVVRIESKLFRSKDERMLGVAILYMRPRDHSYIVSPFPKTKTCPSDGGSASLVRQVFRAEVSFF